MKKKERNGKYHKMLMDSCGQLYPADWCDPLDVPEEGFSFVWVHVCKYNPNRKRLSRMIPEITKQGSILSVMPPLTKWGRRK
jgi:hypothetical protein